MDLPIWASYALAGLTAPFFLFGATATSASGLNSNPSDCICTSITAAEITALGNNTLFTRWRPYSHFAAPAGWMNDPCGASYDPTRDQYNLFYQWHPNHIEFGNISWGYATSRDMITWTDHVGWRDAEAKALGPEGYGKYNGLGIFSGTAQPVNLQGEVDGTLLLMYTSVSYLPEGWDEYYRPYTETQSLALSHDGGLTFEEYAHNPVIDATTGTAPMYWNLTGFRDPFLEPFPAIDALRQVDEPHWYAVFGSGIKNVGPRMPLWTAPKSNLTQWSFLGALWEPEKNSSLGPVLATRTYGFNFEVSGFFSLPDTRAELHYFVDMGAEGGNLTFENYEHDALWNEGLVSRRDNGSVEFTPIAGGAADWGIGYACSSFNDTKNDRRVQFCWVEEDIIGDDGVFSAKQQGFQGAHTLPRRLFVHEVAGVVDEDGTLAASKNAVLTRLANGTYLVQTLGVEPIVETLQLTNGSEACSFGEETYTSSRILKQEGSSSMELKATISTANGAVGVIVAASPDLEEYTIIMYEPSNHTLLVERAHSSLIDEFNNATVTGYFHPYSIRSAGNPTTEAITMDVWLDGSLLEVYVNSRFALSTRIYPSMTCSTGYGVYIGEGGQATFSGFEAWEGLAHVWPERPLNSSSKLVWDSPAETGNYTWWNGD